MTEPTYLLWKRIEALTTRIIKLKDEYEEFKKYASRKEETYKNEITTLYKESFDLYEQILKDIYPTKE